MPTSAHAYMRTRLHNKAQCPYRPYKIKAWVTGTSTSCALSQNFRRRRLSSLVGRFIGHISVLALHLDRTRVQLSGCNGFSLKQWAHLMRLNYGARS